VVGEFEKTGIKLVTRKGRAIRDHNAFYRGSDHGATVNLNRPLGDGTEPIAGHLT
jgi:hypothetical protein